MRLCGRGPISRAKRWRRMAASRGAHCRPGCRRRLRTARRECVRPPDRSARLRRENAADREHRAIPRSGSARACVSSLPSITRAGSGWPWKSPAVAERAVPAQRQTGILPGVQAAIEQPDTFAFAEPEQQPPGACGEGSRPVVVEHDLAVVADSPGAQALAELLRVGQGMAATAPRAVPGPTKSRSRSACCARGRWPAAWARRP